MALEPVVATGLPYHCDICCDMQTIIPDSNLAIRISNQIPAEVVEPYSSIPSNTIPIEDQGIYVMNWHVIQSIIAILFSITYILSASNHFLHMFTAFEMDTLASETDTYEVKSMILIISVICSMYAVSRDHMFNENAWNTTKEGVHHSIGLLIVPLLICTSFLVFTLATTTR
jgi:hypothetical protein